MSKAPDQSLPAQRASLVETALRTYRTLLGESTARKGLLSISGQAVISATSFLTTVLIGRYCSKQELGYYALALSIVLLMRAIQGELIAAPFTVYSQRRKKRDLATYNGSVVVHQLLFCAASALCIAILLVVFSCGYGPQGIIPTLLVLLVGAPLLLLRCFARHFLFAQLRFERALVFDIMAAACQLGVLFGLVFTVGTSSPVTYLVMSGTCLVVCAVWYWVGRSELAFERKAIRDDFKDNWRFARWALPSQLIGCSTPYVMPWVLQFGHGEAATGMYAVCTTLVGLSHMFVCGVGNVLTPKATRSFLDGGVAALKATLWKTSFVLTLPLLAVTAGVILLGDALPLLIFGDKFDGLGTICLLLALSATVNAIGVVAGNGLWALDRPRANLWGDVATLLTTVSAAILLVLPLGLAGAALATLTGIVVGTVARCITLSRCLKSAVWPPPSMSK